MKNEEDIGSDTTRNQTQERNVYRLHHLRKRLYSRPSDHSNSRIMEDCKKKKFLKGREEWNKKEERGEGRITGTEKLL